MRAAVCIFTELNITLHFPVSVSLSFMQEWYKIILKKVSKKSAADSSFCTKKSRRQLPIQNKIVAVGVL
jgi:hypothetical protein